MENNSVSKALRVLVVFYGLAYAFLFILPMLTMNESTSDYVPTKTEIATTVFAFMVYLSGTIVMFYNEKLGGIVLSLWHFVIWLFAFSIWPDAGMVLILCFPVLIMAVFLMLNWYKKNDKRYQSGINRWKLVLKLLTINYTAIYLWVALAQIGPKSFGWTINENIDQLGAWEYSVFSKVVLLVLLGFYLLGVGLSNRSKWVAGLIFIIWYISVLILSYENLEFGHSGPYAVFGVVILAQGVLYLAYYMKKNEIEHENR